MERIGPYEVLREVARGGMGVVYRARDVRSGMEVALKLLLSGRAASEPQRKRFLREGQALTQLSHPHLVAVRELGEHQGAPFLAMEWVEGQTLQDRLDRHGPLPLPEALGLARALADALGYAHAAGVLHRDLKPANVLLRRDGTPVLTDFGLTRSLDPSLDQSRLSRTGEFMGTPGYWPPEQARGQVARVGAHSDVYGLGAVLYAALTGQAPFGEPASILEAVAWTEQLPDPPSSIRAGIPPALDALVLRCLAPEPEARFPTATALLSALNVVQAAAPPARAAPLRAAPAAILLLGALSAAALLLARGTPASSPAPGRPTPGEAAPADDPEAEAARAEAALQAGRRLYADGDYVRARDAFGRALALRPDWVECLLCRALAAGRAGDLQGALADFSRALELEPESAVAWNDRATIRREWGDFAGAADDFSRAIELDPRHPTAFLDRGASRAELGDLDGAWADLTRGVELRPEDPLAWFNRGVVAQRRGDEEAALASYSTAIALAPPHAGALVNRAAIRVGRGDAAGAAQDMRRALELEPDAPWAEQLRQQLARLDPEAAPPGDGE